MNKLAVFITGGLFVLVLIFSFKTSNKTYLLNGLSIQGSIEDNIYREDYVDENGVITMHPLNLYATLIQIRDSNGNPIKEYYLDVNGNRVMRSGGYHGINRIYRNGLCVQYTYIDEEEHLVNNASGYASVKQIYNDQGQVTEAYYYDTEGQPVAIGNGQYGEHREYNLQGKNYMTTFVDESGNFIENTRGFSTIQREYNADGQISREWYLDLSGEKANIGRKQYGLRYIYKNGVYVKTVPIDAAGHDLFYLDRWIQSMPWISCAIALAILMISLFLKREMRVRLLVFYVIVILYLTLFNREQGSRISNLEVFWSYKQFFESPELGLQILNNIWLFLPLGALLCSLKREWKVFLFAIGLTVFIESIQYIFGLGLCEIDDIIGNSLGAWLGWGCYCEGIKWKNKRYTVK